MVRSILAQLNQEHQVARDIVDVFIALSDGLKKERSVSLLYLRDLVEAVNSIIECHHKKEMEVFELLVRNEQVGKTTLIGVLQEEHNLGEEYLANMLRIINNREHDKQMKYEVLPFHMEQYAQLLKAHIEKEDAGFLPLIQQYMLPEQQAALDGQMKNIEHQYNISKPVLLITEAKKRYVH